MVMGPDRKAYLALMIMSPSALDVRPGAVGFSGDQRELLGPARYIPAFANVQVSTEAGGPPWINALCDIDHIMCYIYIYIIMIYTSNPNIAIHKETIV